MKAKDHPEFRIESSTLAKVFSAIKEITKQNKPEYLGGGDDWANHALSRRFQEKNEKYIRALDEPYFGRLDFNTGLSEIFYIGKQGLDLDGIHVTDWRAPIARLYYSSNVIKQSYRAPSGLVTGKLLLRRAIKIKNGELLDIQDLFDYRDGQSQQVVERDKQRLIIEEIQARGDLNLQDIVKTIQTEQDEIIRASKNQIIVIDGVAGSGKTSIAFHRLAYLLFPDNGFKIQANNCIVFCPNKIFLHYIEDLLPGLGITEVQQTTFVDWAFEQMRLTDYDYVDTSLTKFTIQDTHKEELRFLWRKSQFKGSLKFASLLENYSSYLKASISFPLQGISVVFTDDKSITISWDHDFLNELRDKFLREKEMPYNQIRQEILRNLKSGLRQRLDSKVQQLIDSINEEAENNMRSAIQMEDESESIEQLLKARKILQKTNTYRQYLNIPSAKNKVLIDLNKQLDAIFETIWKEQETVHLYYGLLRDSVLLNETNQGIFTEEELGIINTSIFDGVSIELEDVPALFHLHQLLNKVSKVNYDHIVIDEVQDCSPIMLKIIKQYNNSQSMTLAGDLSQSIHAYRGIQSWDVLRDVFVTSKFDVISVNKNYRNTKEIVNFTNRVFKKLIPNKDRPLPTSIERSGQKPKLKKFASEDKMLEAVANEIDYVKSNFQFGNIALITKSSNEAENLFLKLQESDYDVSTKILHDKVEKYDGGVVCLPVKLAKGLEFEAAIVIDASDKRYKDDVAYDGQLLYVAITRALHYLCVFFVGDISKYLI